MNKMMGLALSLFLASLVAPFQANAQTPTIQHSPETLQLNGRSLNGWSLNGTELNGRMFNGRMFNGRMFNGKFLNGKLFNGSDSTGFSAYSGPNFHVNKGPLSGILLTQVKVLPSQNEAKLIAPQR